MTDCCINTHLYNFIFGVNIAGKCRIIKFFSKKSAFFCKKAWDNPAYFIILKDPAMGGAKKN